MKRVISPVAMVAHKTRMKVYERLAAKGLSIKANPTKEELRGIIEKGVTYESLIDLATGDQRAKDGTR